MPIGLAILSFGVSILLDLPQYNLPVGIWLFVVFMFLQVGVLAWDNWAMKNAKPIIKLKDFGFEIKRLADKPWSVCAYVDVYNEPKEKAVNDVNAIGVYPNITWVDEHKDTVDENNGRWFYADEDKAGVDKLLSADLEASGKPRRLHFTYSVNQDMTLHSLWRKENGEDEAKRHGSQFGYYVKIHLKSTNNAKAEFYFQIKFKDTEAWPYQALRLERLDKENGVVDFKTFDFLCLHNWEEQHKNDKLHVERNSATS